MLLFPELFRVSVLQNPFCQLIMFQNKISRLAVRRCRQLVYQKLDLEPESAGVPAGPQWSGQVRKVLRLKLPLGIREVNQTNMSMGYDEIR